MTWVLARVQPNVDSGKIEIVNEKEEREGKGDGDSRIVANRKVKGTILVLKQIIGSESTKTIEYEWQVPGYKYGSNFMMMAPSTSPEDTITHNIAYNPFTSGGTIVCQIPIESNKIAKIGFTFLIPDDWDYLVYPAVKYYKKFPRTFSPTDVAVNKSKLQKLLEDSNPIIAIMACETLANAHLLDKLFVDGPLKNTVDLRQAVFVYMFLSSSSTEAIGKSGIQDFIRNSENLVELRNVALGAFTACNPFISLRIDSQSLPPAVNGKLLLKDVKYAYDRLVKQGEKDDDIREILKVLD